MSAPLELADDGLVEDADLAVENERRGRKRLDCGDELREAGVVPAGAAHELGSVPVLEASIRQPSFFSSCTHPARWKGWATRVGCMRPPVGRGHATIGS